jgi:murein DD-endopeptidase MepM/ murein hydrolase activator NlpD
VGGAAASRVAVLLAALAVGGGCRESAPEGATAVAAPSSFASPDAAAPGVAVQVAQPLEVSVARLGRGGSLHAALDALQIPSELHAPILEALGRHVDFRRLPAETGLSVVRSISGSVLSVACRPAFEHYVRVMLGPAAVPSAARVDVPIRMEVETAGAVVQTSVAAALVGHRDAATLTLLFADIFQWDVDLFVDPRPGDRVRLVYTSRSLGKPEPDLPPFGGIGVEEGTHLGVERVLAASYEGAVAGSTAFWVEADGRGGDYYDAEGQPLRKAFLKSPLNYRRISSKFTNQRRHPITRKVVPHHGVDFAAASGTPVVAAADGRVLSAGWDGALGNAVRIRHGNGYKTIYGHLRAFAKGIRAGAQVEQNQIIGYVGATGRATGPHLHYTMLLNDRAINPLSFRNPSAEPLAEVHRADLEQARLAWTPVLLAIRPGESEVGIARAAEAASTPGGDG